MVSPHPAGSGLHVPTTQWKPLKPTVLFVACGSLSDVSFVVDPLDLLVSTPSPRPHLVAKKGKSRVFAFCLAY